MDSSLETCKIALEVASDRRALQPICLDLGPGATLCRYLIIVSFETTVQVVSLAREMEQEIESRLSRKCLGMEGKQDGGWVLLDYGDVVINVMEQRRRDLYRLEELWQQASELELI